MGKRRQMLGSIGLLVVAGTIGAACGGAGGAPSAARGAGDTATVAPRPAEAPPAAGEFSSMADVIPVAGPKIIKTASVSLELKQGTFDSRLQDVVQVAGRHAGYVASSRTSAGKHPTATVVLRVPADQFEQALGELKVLGKVTAQEVSGQDVTAEFVDLEARLRNWEAQEDVLLGLMAKATTIEDSIRVQRSLQDVQLAIEEIKGQLRVLGDRTDFSTISVALSEAGAPVPKPQGAISKAWHRAVDGFLAVIAAVVVVLGYLVPLTLLVGVAALVWLGVMRRARARTDTAPMA